MCTQCRSPIEMITPAERRRLREELIKAVRDAAEHDRPSFHSFGLLFCGVLLIGLGVIGQWTDAPGDAIGICWGVGAVLFAGGWITVRRAWR